MNIREAANRFLAAVSLPPLPPAKVKPKQTSLPSFRTQVAPSAAVIVRPDRQLSNTDVLDYRLGQDSKTVIQNLAESSPDLSATSNAYLRVGIPEKFVVVARDLDGKVNPQATGAAHEILRRVTYLGDPNLGFNSFASLPEISAMLGKQLLETGSVALELVLDRSRLPTRLVAIDTKKIEYYEDDTGVRPVQNVGGTVIDLDIPTIFIYNQDQNLNTPYSRSMFEPAVQSVLADSQFLNDLRRVMKRSIQPRLVATLIEEKLMAAMPPEIKNDPDKAAEFTNAVIAELEGVVNGLNPEDALVGTDSVEFSYLKSEGGGGNVGDTLKAVQELLNSKLAAGAKTLPVILGRGSGSGTAASVDTMLFLKNANAIRVMLNVVYSRALTQAVRLLGQDVYVEFIYDELDMRPAAEQEAYFAMRQSRILEQLSLGMISDEQACIMLTGNLPPEGYTPLAGTMFKGGTSIAANPDSQTSNMGAGSVRDTPAAPRGGASANLRAI